MRKVTKRPTRRANGLTLQPLGHFLERSERYWGVIVLALLVVSACASHQTTTSGLPFPPLPTQEQKVLLGYLDGPEWSDLILWLDEIERYFEGVECWIHAETEASRIFCEFE